MPPTSAKLLSILSLLAMASAFGQTNSWKVTDANTSTVINTVRLITNEAGGDTLNVLIKIEASTPMRVDVAASLDTGIAGNWLKYASVFPTADCTRAPYINYPTSFSSVTPIYMCISAPKGLTKGWYAAYLTFTPVAPSTGARFTLPIQLSAFPTGYLLLGSTLGSLDLAGQTFTYSVNNGVADSPKSAYAAVVDPQDLSGAPISKVPLSIIARDDSGAEAPWVTYSAADAVTGAPLSSPATSALLRIGIDPSRLPPGQSDVRARLRVNSPQPYPGESNILITTNVTLPPPTLSVPGLTSVNFSYPAGPLTQTAQVQSSGDPISFSATASADDGTAWLSVTQTSNTTPAQITIAATVMATRIAGTYTGTVTVAPTGGAGPAVRIPVTLQVSSAPSNDLLYFVPIVPCHIMDTRVGQGTSGEFGPPTMSAGQTRSVRVNSGRCTSIPSTAKAYSLSITAATTGYLGYLTVWPTGQPQPVVSTLNGPRGRSVSNAAIVPAGNDGGISVYVTDQTDVMIDVNGYFDAAAPANATAFYPLAPCRIADTRGPSGAFGGPTLAGGTSRDFPIATSNCLPLGTSPKAYSLNVTVVPGQALDNLELWPSDVSRPPQASTLTAPYGDVIANAAIAMAGTNGAVSAYSTSKSDLVLDINGYFGPPGRPGALLFRPLTPCRVADTRGPGGALGGPTMAGRSSRDFPIRSGSCGVPSNAAAYSFNVTVVPRTGYLGYLTVWPTGQSQPFVSTLNSFDGRFVPNAAIVPAGSNGSVTVFVTDDADVVLDINGYFVISN